MPSIACHLSVCRLTDGIFISILAALSSRSGHLQAWVGVMCPSWPRGMHSVSRVVHFEQAKGSHLVWRLCGVMTASVLTVLKAIA